MHKIAFSDAYTLYSVSQGSVKTDDLLIFWYCRGVKLAVTLHREN